MIKLLKEHVDLAAKVYNTKLKFDNIKEFNMNELDNCCQKIKEKSFQEELYMDCQIIQREIIRDTRTIDYLIKLYQEGINLTKTRDLVEAIQANEDKLVNYNINQVINVLKDTKLYHNVAYLYLKYFSNTIKSNIGKKVVINNLEYFLLQNKLKINDLTSEQIKLFTSPILSEYNLIPIDNIKETYELLVKNSELKRLLFFLYLNKLTIRFKIEDYEKINSNIQKVSENIKSISNLLDKKTMKNLLIRWVENECNICDLEIINQKISNIEKEEIEEILSNRSSYINFVLGNKISNFKMENIDGKKEELIVYAIRNNKNAFLKLIEQNQEEFLRIPSFSILYDKDFYTKYVNINGLNLKDIKELQFMNSSKSYIDSLQEGTYTFNEIKTLYETFNENYYKFYNNLMNLKIDERIIRIKQLKNIELFTLKLSSSEIETLSDKIQIKSLYNWMEQDFKQIQGITPKDIVKILINYQDIDKFIFQIKDRNELLYILRNKETIQKYNSLEEIKNNIEKIDRYWNELVNIMKLSPQFIIRNKNHIKRFLLNNGAELALTYYNQCENDKKRDSYKLIIKSELMGEFSKLKYYSNDLNKEINIDLKDYQINEWTRSNIKVCDGDIEVSEYDDFYHTMILGEEPMRTCLSYKDGAYNRCLLACFDSNKKILYAKIHGEIVARAMVRLTKGTYNDISERQSLSFVDLENVSDNDENINERLTIFLERAYISGISEKTIRKIEKMFIEAVQKKSEKMNALLVLSNYYNSRVNESYITTNYYMYISKSKAGSQYLDSLYGQSKITDEGQYKLSRFLIWKPKENKINLLNESIFG